MRASTSPLEMLLHLPTVQCGPKGSLRPFPKPFRRRLAASDVPPLFVLHCSSHNTQCYSRPVLSLYGCVWHGRSLAALLEHFAEGAETLTDHCS
eukprot:3141141-Alexandrium_andersonii.AAC.1